MNHKIISALLILTLASLACGFSIDLPNAAGPDVTDEISVPAPGGGETRLSLAFGAGELRLAPGAEEGLVDGTVTYNIEDLKPIVEQDGSEVTIRQGNYEFKGVPTLNNIKNVWDLKLGDTPMELSLDAGAYEGQMELGGLALTNLTIQDGAAQVKVSFASPNAAEMSILRYETGASDVTLTGLANANFESMFFDGGAGNYELDFSGHLQRDATISIDCGLSDLTLRVPEGVHATVTFDGGLSNVNTSSNWSRNNGSYGQDGDGPTLTFIINMGAGNLTLTH
ncbi:MAG: toast rack family protein [Gammaproteobacteria bacterium]